MSVLFERLDELELLLRCYAPENGVFLCCGSNFRVCLEGGRVDIAVGVFEAGLFGDVRDGVRVIAGDNLERDALIGKIGKCPFGARTDFIAEKNQGNGI